MIDFLSDFQRDFDDPRPSSHQTSLEFTPDKQTHNIKACVQMRSIYATPFFVQARQTLYS